MKKKQKIHIDILFNKDNVPEKMEWDASGSPMPGDKECKAFLLALWDGNAKQALRMDLWTKEMQVEEMHHFFFQTFMTLGETFANATGDKATADEIHTFGKQFGEKLGVIKKTS
ncbi:MAG: gliding motility protein GldC [Chitinophagales bacterium]